MTVPQAFISLWQRIPFRPMSLLVVVLFLIKEEFPFSNFPMYSNFDEEADVVFITDQNNNALPMEPLFGKGSAGTKKIYEAELALLCNKDKRDTEQATAAERQQAAQTTLAGLVKKLKSKALPSGTTDLRFQLRTFAYDAQQSRVLLDRPAELLASQKL
jgi:hypothetical protein